jgi:hypothetical protein
MGLDWASRHSPKHLLRAYLSRQLDTPGGLFGQLCRRLAIFVIPAFSPQAKGRVERSNQTHQHRLIPQLRLANVQSIQQANAFLPRYLAAHNHKFALDYAALPNIHRPLPKLASLDDFCFTETSRKLANDWTVQFRGHCYQLLPLRSHCPAKSSITVRTTFNGKLLFLHRHQPLQFRLFHP